MRLTFEEKCARAAERAIGCDYRVVQKKRTVSGGRVIVVGKIVECSYKGDSCDTALFSITLEFGPNKIREKFTINKLPRRNLAS